MRSIRTRNWQQGDEVMHEKDSDCTLDDDLQCTVCGVSHVGECTECGGHGFHNSFCPDIQ
jgi:hypothetical protein